jgi:hypothetical protein
VEQLSLRLHVLKYATLRDRMQLTTDQLYLLALRIPAHIVLGDKAGRSLLTGMIGLCNRSIPDHKNASLCIAQVAV